MEVPDKNTKIGAQKWVTHRVKYKETLGFTTSKGSAVFAVT